MQERKPTAYRKENSQASISLTPFRKYARGQLEEAGKPADFVNAICGPNGFIDLAHYRTRVEDPNALEEQIESRAARRFNFDSKQIQEAKDLTQAYIDEWDKMAPEQRADFSQKNSQKKISSRTAPQGKPLSLSPAKDNVDPSQFVKFFRSTFENTVHPHVKKWSDTKKQAYQDIITRLLLGETVSPEEIKAAGFERSQIIRAAKNVRVKYRLTLR
ncbi:hypothetical protein HYU92_06100 [Candidatus Curtissbacteria bacterium]|nr:hypothetical protein [Candidatus Curtissbacteria bacterium]